MANGDPAYRGTIEQPAGQRGRQQEITLRNREIAVALPLEPEVRAARLGNPRRTDVSSP